MISLAVANICRSLAIRPLMPQRIQEKKVYIRNKLGEGKREMICIPNHSL